MRTRIVRGRRMSLGANTTERGHAAYRLSSAAGHRSVRCSGAGRASPWYSPALSEQSAGGNRKGVAHDEVLVRRGGRCAHLAVRSRAGKTIHSRGLARRGITVTNPNPAPNAFQKGTHTNVQPERL